MRINGGWKKKLAGFTLIEVMVVVGIVAILATIAYPSYTDQIQKSRRSTGKAALQDVAARMEQYYLDNKRYTLGADGTDLTKIGLAATYNSPDGGWYSISAVTNATTYVLTATPRLAQVGDTKCATLTFNNKHEKKSTPAGNSCW
jgi:type IV pilus assembly protein PilE